MDSKQRILNLLNHKEADRVGILDAYWEETLLRWKSEGFPDNTDISDYFCHDISFIWFEARLGLKEELVLEDEENKYVKNIDGIIFKIPKKGVPYIKDDVDLPGFPVEYTIKSRSDWLKYKKYFFPNEWRMAFKPEITPAYHGTKETMQDLVNYYSGLKSKKRFIFFSPREPFEATRNMMGSENFFMQIALDKSWIRELFEEQADMIIGMYKIFVSKGFKFDGFWAWGDICFNKGMIISPSDYCKLLLPVHKKLFGFFRNQDMHVAYHTDGFIDEALPLLVEAGITAIQPLEVKAGNSIFEIKKKYGRNLTCFGNIDSRIMAGSRKEIESEIKEKVTFAKKGGGYIYHSDHSVPADVSFSNYVFVMDCVKKYGSY
ncbi:MAG: hypothetical protein M1365_04815 [Actinobacteria bacterium]|nr:hypothetical protein [Actinomycetota bacterium]